MQFEYRGQKFMTESTRYFSPRRSVGHLLVDFRSYHEQIGHDGSVDSQGRVIHMDRLLRVMDTFVENREAA